MINFLPRDEVATTTDKIVVKKTKRTKQKINIVVAATS